MDNASYCEYCAREYKYTKQHYSTKKHIDNIFKRLPQDCQIFFSDEELAVQSTDDLWDIYADHNGWYFDDDGVVCLNIVPVL